MAVPAIPVAVGVPAVEVEVVRRSKRDVPWGPAWVALAACVICLVAAWLVYRWALSPSVPLGWKLGAAGVVVGSAFATAVNAGQFIEAWTVRLRVVVRADTLVIVRRSVVAEQRWEWRRDLVAEVRVGRPLNGEDRSELQVRLRRGDPVGVLSGWRPRALRRAAEQVTDALLRGPTPAPVSAVPASVPLQTVVGTGPVGTASIDYEPLGDPYEVEVRLGTDPRTVIVVIPRPFHRDVAAELEWMIGGGFVAGAVSFIICITCFRLPIGQIVVAGFGIGGLLAGGIVRELFLRRRRGRPIVIELTADAMTVEHPCWLFPRWRWPRARVRDVTIKRIARRNGGGPPVVVIGIRGWPDARVGHGRDWVECRRIARALRKALGLRGPIPGDDASEVA